MRWVVSGVASRLGNRVALIFEILEARHRAELPLVGTGWLVAPLREQRRAGCGSVRTESIFLLLRQVDQLADLGEGQRETGNRRSGKTATIGDFAIA
ncbi:hypothetical protein chiPu_0030495, partial [Chiloscyllium punctatum]|nr:hypothetical protein [Chiloscyllium punctatum]